MQYVRKPMGTSQQPIVSRLKTGSTSLKLYRDCRIPLKIFLDCLYDKDYSGLIIEGRPTREQLLQAWEKVYVEYADLSNDENGNELFKKTVEINYISGKIFCIDKCIKHFHLSYNSELHDILKYYGVDANLQPGDTTEERYRKLKTVIGKTKRWLTELDILRRDFDLMQSTTVAAIGGREVFEENLMHISSFRKYAVLERDITVRQYVKSLKAIDREAQRLQNNL